MMRTILIIVLGLFIAQNVNAQADSLIIKLGDYGQMIIVSSNRVTEKQKSFGLNESYQKFYEDFKKIDKSGLSDKNYLINYNRALWDKKNNRSISIKAIEKLPDVYYFQDGNENSLLSSKYKLTLNYEHVIFLLDSLKDFEKISMLNLDTLYFQSIEHFQSQNLRKKDSYNIFYSSLNNSVDKSSNYIMNKKTLDYLLLGTSFGMTMVSSTFAPEFNVNLEMDLHNKGISKFKFGISSTYLFMPNKNDFFDINTYNFLNASFSMNLLNSGFKLKSKNELSHKISIGYLISRDGDDFSKNTWNAFWQTNINKIGFKIGAYYTNNLEGNRVILPSIGFDFGF
jgi:hypothetical protein